VFILTWIIFLGKIFLKSSEFKICLEIKLLFLLFCVSFTGYFFCPEYYYDFQPLVKQGIMFLTVIAFVLLTYNSHLGIDKIMKWTTVIVIFFTLLEIAYLFFDVDLGYKTIAYLKEEVGRSFSDVKGGIESVGKESSHFSNILLPVIFYWLSRYLFKKSFLDLLLFGILLLFLMLTNSQGGAFAFLVGLVGLLALFLKVKKKDIKIQVAKVILIFSFGFPVLLIHFFRQIDTIVKFATGRADMTKRVSDLTRSNYILSGLDIYKDNILFGTGFGMSRAHYPNYFKKYPYSFINGNMGEAGSLSDLDFGNIVIRFLAETGTVGTLLLVLFLASIYIKIFKISHKSYINTFLFLSLTSLYASFIGFGAISFFHWWFIFAVSLKAIYQEPEVIRGGYVTNEVVSWS